MKTLRTLPWILVMLLIGLLIFRELMPNWQVEDRMDERPIAPAILVKATEIGKLELVHLEIRDMMGYEVKQTFFKDRLMMRIVGEAAGCIDLLKLREEDIRQHGDTVFINMPQPELCYYKLNHRECEVFDMSMTKMFTKVEIVDAAYKKAELKIREIALKSNILTRSKENAQQVLVTMLEAVSGKTVILNFDLEHLEIRPREKRPMG